MAVDDEGLCEIVVIIVQFWDFSVMRHPLSGNHFLEQKSKAFHWHFKSFLNSTCFTCLIIADSNLSLGHPTYVAGFMFCCCAFFAGPMLYQTAERPFIKCIPHTNLIFTHMSRPSFPLFSQGGKKFEICPRFSPNSHFSHPLFEMEQDSENPKQHEASMIALCHLQMWWSLVHAPLS